jgi:hypothetical protein
MEDDNIPPRLSRRTLLIGGSALGVGALAAAFGGGALVGRMTAATPAATTPTPAAPGTRTFVSTSLTTPAVTSSKSGDTQHGYLFLQQKGDGFNGSIIEDSGEPVWIEPSKLNVTDLRPQVFEGQVVLTYWTGKSLGGHGEGTGVILDDSYTRLFEVRAANGLAADLHEFRLTTAGTALLTSYTTQAVDLTPVKGPKNGFIYNCHVQEVDVRSGKLLLDWDVAQHIPVDETYLGITQDTGHDGTSEAKAFDAYHLNSVSEDGADRLLVSLRHTHTAYSIDRRTGEVLWRFGGKESDIAIAEDAVFAWQHDVRRNPSGVITLFDNHEYDTSHGGQSRGMKFAVDESAKTATLLKEYRYRGQLATAMGSVQILDNDHVLVGWGTVPSVVELTADGKPTYVATLGGISYRAARGTWVGKPSTNPDIAAKAQPDGSLEVYASWNGATEVRSWRVLTGETPERLTARATVERAGFETSVRIPTAGIVAVEALDANGVVIGTSKPLPTSLS